MTDRTLGGVSAFRKKNGVEKGHCTWCKAPVPKGRQTWCGLDACLHEYKIRNDPSYARAETFTRDRGVCARCGLDTEAVRAELERLRLHAKSCCEGKRRTVRVASEWGDYDREEPVPSTPESRAERDAALEGYSRAMERAGLPFDVAGISYVHVLYPVGHLWEMDHILPVVEGGGGCGLDNLRTLCLAHHREETRALAKRRADARKAAKGEPVQVSLLKKIGGWLPCGETMR